MICSRGIISRGDGAIRAQKNRAGGLDAPQQCRGALEKRKVFGRQAIDEFRGLRHVARDDDATLRGERLARERQLQPRHDSPRGCLHLKRQFEGGGNENRHGIGVVLRLRNQVRRDPLGVAAAAHQHQFRWSGNEIDAALARHQLLGGSNVAVPRPHDLVHARHGLGSEGEGGDGLRAAQVDRFSLRPTGQRPPERPGRAAER